MFYEHIEKVINICNIEHIEKVLNIVYVAYGLILCTLATDYSLSYCWKLNTSVHQPGGREQHNVTSETECQRRCIADCNCIGVDWTEEPENKDTRIQCWVLLSNAGKKTQTYKKKIRHWTIVRTEPRNCDGK